MSAQFDRFGTERTLALNQEHRPLQPCFIHGRVRTVRFTFTAATAITTSEQVELAIIPKGALLLNGKMRVVIGGTTPDVIIQVAARQFALNDNSNVAWVLLDRTTLEVLSSLTNFDLSTAGLSAGLIRPAIAGIAANTIYDIGAYEPDHANHNQAFNLSPFTQEMSLFADVADLGAGGIIEGYLNYVVD